LVNTSRSATEKALNRRVIFKTILVSDEAESPLDKVIGEVKTPEENLSVKVPLQSLEQAPVKTKMRAAEKPVVKQSTKIAPNPAGLKTSVAIAQQIVVPLSGPRSIKVDASIPVRVDNVPSWCIMFTSNNSYWFQVGSFKTLPDAMSVAKQLKHLMKGNINFVIQDNGVKIQIGSYGSRSAAFQDAQLLYSKGFIK